MTATPRKCCIAQKAALSTERMQHKAETAMFAYDKKTMDAMVGPARQMFEQWISLFPTAPLFGVPWRFAPDLEIFPKDFSLTTPGLSLFSATETFAGDAPARAVKAGPKPAKVVEKTEAIVIEAKPKPSPKTKPTKKPKAKAVTASASSTKTGGPVDQIKGIGPRLAVELGEMGITDVAQIAAMSKAKMTRIDAKLSTINGRCFRDDWIGQAKAMMDAV